MRDIKNRVDAFLKKYGMHYESINFDDCRNAFMEEMEAGLEGKDSSLKMLCTYISTKGEIPVEEPVIVIDAGGTNFRVAVVTFDGNKRPRIEDFNTYDMPGTKGEIGREEFFKAIVQYLEPTIKKSSRIGFCFSYPAEILPNKDGKIISMSKEVKVRDMIGQEVGSNLLKALKYWGHKDDKKIVLLNDTVATLLGGKAEYPDREFQSYIGFILGTGTNTCYIEENKNIKKAQSLDNTEGATIINIESGGFGKAPRGIIDEDFDKNTKNPGSQQFEKMISGAYQGGLILEVIKKAMDDGLFSKGFVDKMGSVSNLISREISNFCYNPYSNNNVLGMCSNSENEDDADNDKQTLYYIIDCIIERSAKLVAVNLAAVIKKSGQGSNPCRPVCITAEGSTFYKSKLFKEKLDYYVKEHLNDRMGIYCEFVKAENATLIGTAIAGLLN